MGVNTGALYIIFIMLVLIGFAYLTSGPTPSQTPIPTGPEVALTVGSTNFTPKRNLQLYNFEGVTITPPVNGLCSKGGDNKNPEAIIGYLPDQSQAVSSTGQIKLWVSDTKPPYISPNELISKANGAVRTPGDRGATAPDGYFWEPQIYIFPQTVDQNGRAYFPNYVQGDYNNVTMLGASYGSDVLPPDSLPPSQFTVEFVWNVQNIGLTDGDYKIEFVVHDGNQELGIKCINIRIYTPPESENQQNKLPL